MPTDPILSPEVQKEERLRKTRGTQNPDPQNTHPRLCRFLFSGSFRPMHEAQLLGVDGTFGTPWALCPDRIKSRGRRRCSTGTWCASPLPSGPSASSSRGREGWGGEGWDGRGRSKGRWSCSNENELSHWIASPPVKTFVGGGRIAGPFSSLFCGGGRIASPLVKTLFLEGVDYPKKRLPFFCP